MLLVLCPLLLLLLLLLLCDSLCFALSCGPLRARRHCDVRPYDMIYQVSSCRDKPSYARGLVLAVFLRRAVALVAIRCEEHLIYEP